MRPRPAPCSLTFASHGCALAGLTHAMAALACGLKRALTGGPSSGMAPPARAARPRACGGGATGTAETAVLAGERPTAGEGTGVAWADVKSTPPLLLPAACVASCCRRLSVSEKWLAARCAFSNWVMKCDVISAACWLSCGLRVAGGMGGLKPVGCAVTGAATR